MTDLFVSQSDLDLAVDVIAAAPQLPDTTKALLTQLVTDIKAAMDDLAEVGIEVVPAPEFTEPPITIGEQFAGSFEPAPLDAPGGGHGVQIKLHKVHR